MLRTSFQKSKHSAMALAGRPRRLVGLGDTQIRPALSPSTPQMSPCCLTVGTLSTSCQAIQQEACACLQRARKSQSWRQTSQLQHRPALSFGGTSCF